MTTLQIGLLFFHPVNRLVCLSCVDCAECPLAICCHRPDVCCSLLLSLLSFSIRCFCLEHVALLVWLIWLIDMRVASCPADVLDGTGCQGQSWWMQIAFVESLIVLLV